VRVERSITVACRPHEAFDRFTLGIGEWWPLRRGFSFGADRCESIHLEPRVGGRFYERFVDGDEFQVGTVTACDPPDRIVFTWEPPVWPGGTEVEVRFAPEGQHRTLVQVEHRGFENLGAEGADTRDRFDNGWPAVLAAYAETVTAGEDGSPTR
jgi:uncharacterized protein YndB with AHSA1/START domain